MPTLSLREAAHQAGTSKSTILRAIQNGRMSAQRTDDGGWAIDPAELLRVYPPQRSTEQPVGQDAPPDATDLRICNARLEAEISALKTILETEKRRADELRAERDRWAAQAERLALPAPTGPPRRWWFSRAA